MGRSSPRKARRCEGRRAVLYLRVGAFRTSRTFLLTCFHPLARVPGSGSFIRQTPSIKYGVTFTRALLSKYVEDIRGSQAQEFVILGSSNGIIEVEAVNLDKIRKKLSLVENLREASLDGENVACAGSSGEIGKTCPSPFSDRLFFFGCRIHASLGIRGLDLTKSLIPSWDTIAEITRELPLLERLALK